ncbi:hypothetical protein FRB98_009227 [Tulasnella sp. 332]|nr:hypothetical protein FRB98_009227 [Tulasnella sp. 332]
MADVQTVTPLRYLVSSYNNPIHHPRTRTASSSPTHYPHISSTAALSITGSAGRIARKRASHPGPTLPSSTGLTNVAAPLFSPSSSSSSSSTPAAELVKLGTIDFDSIVRSLNYLPDAQSVSKHHQHQRKNASNSSNSNSTSTSPPASLISGVASTAMKSSGTSSAPVTGSSSTQQATPLFRIPVVPRRPTARLPLFHPHNTTPLPDISRKQPTPALSNNDASAPSPPAPARRSSARARKPAAKAMALSLGLGSDGSTLDQLPANAETSSDNTGKEVTPVEKSEKKVAARAGGGKSHKAKKGVVDQDAAAGAGEGGDEAAKTTIRRAPKRKVAVMTDSNGGEDGPHSPSPSPVKRPRRGAATTATATATETVTEPSAPSPLSNEVFQEPETPTESNSVKKRKTMDTATSEESAMGVEKDQKSSTLSPPPPAPAKPIKARAPKAPRATAASKARKLAAAVTKGPRSVSSPPSGDEAAEVPMEKPEGNGTSVAQPEGSSVEADGAAEDDGQDEPEVRKLSYNIFEEPLDLKPRPRPVYKSHLKRGSSGSAMGEDKPASRPRKTRRNTRDDIKKDSMPPSATTEETVASESTNNLEQPAISSAEVTRTDAMEVDVPPQVRMHAPIVEGAK